MKQRKEEAVTLKAFANVIEYAASEVYQIGLRRASAKLKTLSRLLSLLASELREAA